MGGRVYDPTIGRFLSADPIIQAPYNSQSYNRYSYVWNNPLSAVDPSGFLRDIPGVKTLGGGMQNLMLGGTSHSCEGACTLDAPKTKMGQVLAALERARDMVRNFTERLKKGGSEMDAWMFENYGSSSQATRDKLISRLENAQSILDKWSKNPKLMTISGKSVAAYAELKYAGHQQTVTNKPEIEIHNAFFDQLSVMRARTLIHEASHFAYFENGRIITGTVDGVFFRTGPAARAYSQEAIKEAVSQEGLYANQARYRALNNAYIFEHFVSGPMSDFSW